MGGDVIRFVELMDGVHFKEAVEKLGERDTSSGRRPVLPPVRSVAPHWEDLDLHQQDLLNRVARHYHEALWKAQEPLAYVRGRGIPDWLIRDQRLGYADGRTLRTTFTNERDKHGLLELGLLQEHDKGPDKPWVGELFRQRVVVPELRGRCCIWLIGRSLTDGSTTPKYLALSGERPILGLERALGAAEVVMCEGVFDYLTATAWRLPAFSTCGTYLPSNRLGFLAGADIVHGVLDPDCAGRLGTERFAEMLERRFRPIQLPRGRDLNDLGLEPGGHQEFLSLLAENRARPGFPQEEKPCA